MGFEHGEMGGWCAHYIVGGWPDMLIPFIFVSFLLLLSLLLWGGLLAVVIARGGSRIFSIGRGGRGELPHAQEGKAEDILRERFAKGELDVEEYEERLRILRGEHRNYSSPLH